jgi:RNA polymerase sigma-70 factor (ECF subfamily)
LTDHFSSNETNENGLVGKRGGVAVSAARSESAQPTSAGPAKLPAEVERAIDELYSRQHAFVWRNARRLGCGDDWVDDAVHEVFLVAARRLPELDGLKSERSWLFAILVRVVQRLVRNRARQRGNLRRFAAEQPPGVVHTASAFESAEYLRHLLGQLPEEQQLVLILIELEGFTSAEVAENLSIPAGTVHSRLRAARLQLARMVERDRESDERSEP